MCNNMNKNYRWIFLLFNMFYILMNTTNGFIHFPSLIVYNYSQLFNQTTNSSWKRSNSIEILKKLIANRQILTKYNRTLVLTNIIQQTTSQSYISTTQVNFLLSPSSSINKTRSYNISTLAIIFICCFIGFLLFTLILTLFRKYITRSYFKLPCIHSLSTNKQSRNSTPLSYSPIDSKHQEKD